MSIRVTVTALALALAAAVAQGGSGMHVEDARVRATAPGQSVAGGFMTVVNTTGADDRLLRVSSPAAPQVQMHNTTMDQGVMRMRPMSDGVVIPAGGRIEFKPRGLHLMFIGLKAPIAAGTAVPVTLEFQRAGRVAVSFRVDAVSASAERSARGP